MTFNLIYLICLKQNHFFSYLDLCMIIWLLRENISCQGRVIKSNKLCPNFQFLYKNI